MSGTIDRAVNPFQQNSSEQSNILVVFILTRELISHQIFTTITVLPLLTWKSLHPSTLICLMTSVALFMNMNWYAIFSLDPYDTVTLHVDHSNNCDPHQQT